MIISHKNTVAHKPSVREAIILQGVDSAPIVEMCKTKTISNFVHSWITDRYADPKDNANLEVTGIAEDEKSTKRKTTNNCQIVKNDFGVSERKNAIEQYGGKKELDYITAKKGIEHMKELEYALLGIGNTDVFAPPVDMTDTVAGRMGGFFYFVPDEHKKTYTNKDFTMDILHEILEPVWAKGGIDDGNFKIFLGSALKGKVNKWIEKNPALRINVTDNKIDSRVTKIATDFGTVDIVLHRLFAGEKLKDKVLVGNLDEATICFLTDTQLRDISTDKTAKFKRYYTDFTLEVANADYFASAVGLK